MKRIEVDAFLTGNDLIVDVRSPLEYNSGHIVGAVNFPIFEDDERAEVGTLYKKMGKETAVLKGLEIIGPKMSRIAKDVKELANNRNVSTYCWRGGMRSASMAWLFETTGLQVNVLNGGYKNYRNHLLQQFEKYRYIIVQGPTGSGKTDVLQFMKHKGAQVLDLEQIANHKGSAFGALGQIEQPTTEMFQNFCFTELTGFDHSKPVWIESESKTIGKVYLPETLWLKMKTSEMVTIDLPKFCRTQRIIKDYGQFSTTELVNCLIKLERKFGPDRTSAAIYLLENDGLPDVVDQLLDYYDKQYVYGQNRNDRKVLRNFTAKNCEVESLAMEILSFATKQLQ